MKILNDVNSTLDIKKLNFEKLNILSGEIRDFLIENISKTGGHLASNLGIVELTLAIHKVFDFSKDKIIFDVGHQSYVHKIITGRKDKFSTLRKLDGISGFPKVDESEYDFFDTGHCSNSLSVAVGMKRAKELKKEDGNVIALLGDGSFGGGMVYEAINDIGQKKDKVIIILNDNQMSISKNQSSISKYLSRIRVNRSYLDAKNKIESKISNYDILINGARKIKNGVRSMFISSEALFESLGIKYYGPFDGHNIREICEILENVKHMNCPVLVHVTTTKGKGYSYAETDPTKFHGISSFDVETGDKNIRRKDFSAVFGDELVTIAKENDNVVAITAAMCDGTGLSKFSKLFPDRFFDVGICEQHAVSMCGGLAKEGVIPVFAVYSSFLQRGFDQLITDVALMNLHVVFGVDRAGIVGEDGETHQGLFDISYLSCIPNMTVLSPSDFDELRLMLNYAINELKGPVAVRYPRGNEEKSFDCNAVIEYGKSLLVEQGDFATVVYFGRMGQLAKELSDEFKKIGKTVDVINLRFLKPLDTSSVKKSVNKTKRLILIEESIKNGGVGDSLLSSIKDCEFEYVRRYIKDEFVRHGSACELLDIYGFSKESIMRESREVFGF